VRGLQLDGVQSSHTVYIFNCKDSVIQVRCNDVGGAQPFKVGHIRLGLARTIYIRYFWQGNHQIYGHIRCIFTVLANPTHSLRVGCNHVGGALPFKMGRIRLEFTQACIWVDTNIRPAGL